jgi:opacity protein-like surface antigen
MNRLGIAGATAAFALLFCTSFGKAADMPPPIVQALAPPFVELGSSWYLRGDFAYRQYDNPRVNDGVQNLTNTGIGEATVLTLGVGKQFNSWFRADVTIDYSFPATFRGNNSCGVACTTADRAELANIGVFANGYIDLGTWFGVTPYIGAGVGAAHHAIKNYTVDGLQVNDSGSKWSFAYAAMAGVNYAVSPNLSFDFGYRYVDLGKARIAPYNFDDLTAHEFKIGFRYLID